MKDEQTHLGLILDSSLTVHSHIKDKAIKANRGIGMIRYLSKYLTSDLLDQLYKLYVLPHLDYGDIIYHRNDSDFRLDFANKLEAIQYSAALAVSGARHGTNRQNLYEELGWESLYHRRWYRRLTHFYKLKNTQSSLYLYILIPAERELRYNLRMPHPYDPQIERTMRFWNTYFQNCISEWNRLDVSERSCTTISEFKRDYCCVLDPPKDLYLTFMTLEESSYLLNSELNLAISMNTVLGTTFYVQVHSSHAEQVLKIMNTSSCTAHTFLPIEETSLTCSLDRSILTLCAFLLRS